MTKNSFIFLGDLLDLSGLTDLKIIDKYKFKKAEQDEQLYIKKRIDSYSQILDYGINRFEDEKIKTDKQTTSYRPLDEKDWNYWVIESPHLNHEIEFSLALSLSQADLTELFHGHYAGLKTNTGVEVPGLQMNVLTVLNFFIDNQSHSTDKKKLSDNDLLEIGNLYSLIKALNAREVKYDFIEKCLQDYLKINDISKRSPFKTLSYFAILEHLLTTNKRQNENSINNQLQRKITLLNNQFKEKIEIGEFFKGPDTNTIGTIVSKLYQYRNDIAHGNKSDFEKDLFLLKTSKSQIPDFLKLLLKRTLIYSLTEFELINDLREC